MLFDSLSSLQAIYNLKYDHPILIKKKKKKRTKKELYMELTRDGKPNKPDGFCGR